MIVGVAGFRGSGKDTLANILQELIPGSVRMSMATPLKDMVAYMFDWDRNMLEGDTPESRRRRLIPDGRWQHLVGHGIFQDDDIITPVLALQRVGTDLIRGHIHDDFWLDLFRLRSEAYRGCVIIVSDARFPNELEACDFTIRITRSTNSARIQDQHPSEISHLSHNYDLVIENDGSLEDLRSRAKTIIPRLLS